MKYLVLARRYRPQLFCDVVGQEAVLKTLKNALNHKRVAHAYLFCGSRGIGKTTLARLFAKALNCQALTSDCEPCNLCPSCVEIVSGQSFDVIEIDGASNRGIDDIRSLNETAGYAPSNGKYKIYIIDEVHMLTKEAFNALLKILEEPPERAKFFFATTEPHKVLPTIISRCQRFDLQRISEEQIAGKLQAIARDLKRDAAPEALYRIAQFSEGSLRDAESLFDQILCFADGAIQLEHVQSVLGLVPDEFFASFDRAFAEGRIAYAFELVETLFQMGKDLTHFTEQLVGHYRRLTAFRLSPETQNEHESRRLAEAAKLYTQAQLCFILDTLLNAIGQMHKSPMQRVSLEALLLKILRSKQRIPLEVLARRLSELEDKLLTTQSPEAPSPSPPLETQPRASIVEESTPFNPPAEREAEEKVEAPIQQPSPPQKIQSSEPIVLEPVPFNPYTVRQVEEKVETPSPMQQIPPPKEANLAPPVHMETLLRFAAVELEGTIQLEK